MRHNEDSFAAAGTETFGAVRAISLDAGDLLFREGDLKSGIYRVESGAICSYLASGSSGEALREFSYRGDWLGFGYLDRQICRARAIVATRVACFPRTAASIIAERDGRAGRRLADAIEREFALQREANVERAFTPVVRVASFLLSLASLNRHEGRDPHIIVESMLCGLVAESLSMSIDTLVAALRLLEQRGLIEPRMPQGLCLRDVAGLEAVASGRGPRTMQGRAKARSVDADFRSVP